VYTYGQIGYLNAAIKGILKKQQLSSLPKKLSQGEE
jgi:hypothetical protein